MARTTRKLITRADANKIFDHFRDQLTSIYPTLTEKYRIDHGDGYMLTWWAVNSHLGFNMRITPDAKLSKGCVKLFISPTRTKVDAEAELEHFKAALKNLFPDAINNGFSTYSWENSFTIFVEDLI